jgi:hypothetical protein
MVKLGCCAFIHVTINISVVASSRYCYETDSLNSSSALYHYHHAYHLCDAGLNEKVDRSGIIICLHDWEK